MGNTILLADKSITIQKIVELTFADENIVIKSVNDGQSALDAIPQVRPDIILADISLPGKNGYELCRMLRTEPAFSEFANTPVILLAGIYETMDEERARQVQEKVKEVGANDFLSKPFDPQLLTTKVKELMSRGPVPVSEAPAAAPEANIFDEVPAPPQDIFAEPSLETAAAEEEMMTFEERPPDDSDKTMMLPSAPAFGAKMFAETPPFEEEPAPAESAPLDVEAASPVSEPVFGEEEMKAAPEEFPEVQEEVEELGAPEPEGAFAGREEVEFGMSATPSPAPIVDESPFGEEEQPAAEVPPIVAAADEPFGDVFAEEPVAQQEWTPAVVSEEETPFGVAEPPAPAVAEPSAPAVLEPEPAPAGDVWSLPSSPMESVETLGEEDRQQMEEIMGEPEMKPEFGEDTWSRAQAQVEAEQPVEELFEPSAELASPEEAEELQPDLSESGFMAEAEQEVVPEAPVQEPEPAPSAPPVVSVASPLEITDELIERIAEKVVAKLSERFVSEIVWQVVPDLAEKMIRRELEKLHAAGEH